MVKPVDQPMPTFMKCLTSKDGMATQDSAADRSAGHRPGRILADSQDGVDTELVLRACYEMAVAHFRGMGTAAGIEDLVRRAIDYACTSNQSNIVDDAATLASYWGAMWSTEVRPGMLNLSDLWHVPRSVARVLSTFGILGTLGPAS